MYTKLFVFQSSLFSIPKIQMLNGRVNPSTTGPFHAHLVRLSHMSFLSLIAPPFHCMDSALPPTPGQTFWILE